MFFSYNMLMSIKKMSDNALNLIFYFYICIVLLRNF